jgi:hypothetical protein
MTTQHPAASTPLGGSPEQLAYLAARARFEPIAAEHERRLAPIFEHDFTSIDEELEVRRQLSAELGYWEAYDALLLAGRALLAWAQTWLRAWPALLRLHPDLEQLFAGTLPIDRREEPLMRLALLREQRPVEGEVEP